MKKIAVISLILIIILLSYLNLKNKTNLSYVPINEVGISIGVPNDFKLDKSTYWDENQILAYQFKQVSRENIQPPYFDSTIFLTEETLKDWVKNCTADCLEQYPDGGPSPKDELKKYYEQKNLFNNGALKETFEFNGRKWLVSNEPCIGDSCEFRTYTTFIGDIQMIVRIVGWRPEAFTNKKADDIFSTLKIRNL